MFGKSSHSPRNKLKVAEENPTRLNPLVHKKRCDRNLFSPKQTHVFFGVNLFQLFPK